MFQVDFAVVTQPHLAVGLEVDRDARPALQSMIVHVVDPDDRARNALSRILAAVGIVTQEYDGLGGLLAISPLDRPGCLILDSKVPLASLTELRDQPLELFPAAPHYCDGVAGRCRHGGPRDEVGCNRPA